LFSADNSYYMILNQPFSLHVGALSASDASITWNFATANVTIVVQNINNSYNELISNSSSDSGFVEAIDTSDK